MMEVVVTAGAIGRAKL